jgi:hypothetical protein
MVQCARSARRVLWQPPRDRRDQYRRLGSRRDRSARRHAYAFAPDDRIEVRVELLDAMTGGTVSGVDLVDGDMSDRPFATIDGMLVSGLERERIRAFSCRERTRDS